MDFPIILMRKGQFSDFLICKYRFSDFPMFLCAIYSTVESLGGSRTVYQHALRGSQLVLGGSQLVFGKFSARVEKFSARVREFSVRVERLSARVGKFSTRD